MKQRVYLPRSNYPAPKYLIYFVYWVSIIFFAPSLVWGQTTIPPEGKSGVIEKSLRKSRPEFQPPPEEKIPDISIDDSRTLVDPGAGPSFLVRRIEVEGNTLIDNETLAPLVEIGEQTEMTLGVLTLYANEITAFYNTEGYFLTRAYIPKQAVKNGVVVIKVAEGRVGKVQVKGAERLSNEDFVNRLQQVQEEEVLREQTLERVLLELNDLIGVQVSTILKPGDLPGTSDLVLEVTETRPYRISFDADNFGSRFTGRNRFGVTGIFGSIFKLGDQFSIRGVRSDAGQNFISPSFLFPVHRSGTTVQGTFTFSEHNLGDTLSALNAGGSSRIYNVEVTQPLHRSRTTRFFVRGGIEFKHFKNQLGGLTSSEDNLGDVYFSLGGNHTDLFRGRTFLDARVQVGFLQENPNRPLNSRSQGRGDVVIGNLSLVRYQSTGILNSYFLLRADGQVASERALSPDLLSIGGIGTVRGFPLSEFSGDDGYAVSLEYVVPSPWKPSVRFGNLTLDRILSLFGFIDHGKVFILDRQSGENDQSITGVGAGMRVNIPAVKPMDTSVSFAVLYGVPVFGSPDPSDGSSSGTVYLSGLITY